VRAPRLGAVCGAAHACDALHTAVITGTFFNLGMFAPTPALQTAGSLHPQLGTCRAVLAGAHTPPWHCVRRCARVRDDCVIPPTTLVAARSLACDCLRSRHATPDADQLWQQVCHARRCAHTALGVACVPHTRVTSCTPVRTLFTHTRDARTLARSRTHARSDARPNGRTTQPA
jgi:hypothetical protein